MVKSRLSFIICKEIMHIQHYLVITALGSDRIGILEAFTKVSKQCGCNIIESNLSTLGKECVIHLHLAGSWNTIAKLEATLPAFAQESGFALQSKRTFPSEASEALAYQVQVVAQDRPGILNELALFFTQYRINIEQMECETYTIKNNTLMTNITFFIHIPAKQHLATLREKFMTYCEDRNLDALMEPYKN